MKRFDGFQPGKRLPTKPTTFYVCDIEAIEWTEAYAIGFTDGKQYIQFDDKNCIEQFLDFFLTKKFRSSICYAHNGGKYDFTHILHTMRTTERFRGYEIRPIRLQGAFVDIAIIKNKHKWTLRDSFRLMPFSLKAIGEKFGLETKKGAFDHKKINWHNWRELRAEWQPYLQNDCKTLYEALRKQENYLREKYGVTLKRNITLPSVSKDTFQKNYLKAPIANHRAVEEDIRKSYKGARVEIFKAITHNAHHYDINSLYPYVMRTYKYPVGSPVKTRNITLKDFGIAFVTVTVPPTLNIPVLPYKVNNKLCFPAGTFSDWYTTAELCLAKEKGCGIQIHYGYKFPHDYLFREYVDDLYSIKQQAAPDSVDYHMSKLMMNSLYGKFGQKREKKKYVINPQNIIGLTECRPEIEELGLFEWITTSESGYILPAIASYVTSYARIELYKLLDGNDPVYCDTDSITTANELPTSEALGALKHEGDIIEGYYRLPKLYAIKTTDGKTKVRSKGFPQGTLTFEQIKQAVLSGNDSELHFENPRFSTIMESIRRNKTMKSMIVSKRSVKATYDKRTLQGLLASTPIITNEPLSSDNINLKIVGGKRVATIKGN